MQNTPRTGWQFWIDRGGTFTDIVAHTPTGTTQVHKLLSENPDRYEDAPLQGIRNLMGIADNQLIPTEQIDSIKMGTTVATNALLERKGDRTLFITTQGFADGLRIGYQNRPDIFARQIILPEMLYEQVIEVPERLSASGEVLQAITAKNRDQLRSQLQQAYDGGIHSCAIAFLHSYRYPQHEQQIATLAQQVGFTQISVSHQVSPLIKWVSRSDTTVVDAYLSPILRRYIDKLEQTLSPQKADPKRSPKLLFMQSNGGLIPAQQFQGKDSILSGPAGGIVGAVQTSHRAGFDKIITFDMGGTSTDVAHYQRQTDASTPNYEPNYERNYETEVAGVRLRSPMMAIHTVAAGGGSVLSFTDSRYQVGPDSAGAHPGPACYRNGGPLTVTDCNVMVGKLQPDFFPQVFGAQGDQPIDPAVVRAKFEQMGRAIAQQTGETKEPEAIADGFLAIATNNMANAIKKISVQKGYDITDYALCCFGAAGGQHACRLADSLGMKTVFIHPYAGVLSAYGMGLAERRVLKEQSVEMELEGGAIAHLTTQLETLAAQAIAELNAEKDSSIQTIQVLKQLHIRYAGTDSTIAVDLSDSATVKQQFENSYQQQYGITLPNKKLIVATIATEAIGSTVQPNITQDQTQDSAISQQAPAPIATVPMFTGGQWDQTLVFQREHLLPNNPIKGPATILEKTGTNIIEPGWTANVDATGALILQREAAPQSPSQKLSSPVQQHKPDPVKLEIFNNLFQSIAEQMGFTLQNTSSSVNIKERLDFSCAIFDAAGQLVANAPHIPVHLGSMGESVTALIHAIPTLQPGDTYISNNPYNGGTHLPDITAITPVFIENDISNRSQPLFFVASRGHHADIGGITPGSMPPHSTRLTQEGILFDNFQLVNAGTLRLTALNNHLSSGPHPARNPQQNLADLQAQIAANNKGTQELHRMVQQFGLGTVQAYMQHVQDNAEQAVRRAIDQLCQQHGQPHSPTPLSCQVPMDCGATVSVTVTLDPTQRSATLDFTDTSSQQPNNFNAPLAVCKAAVLYVFRTLVDSPIPLNAGCLKPLNILVPAGNLLNPSHPAAVVAGNVETSQAITDALYGALGVLAASQGTMNNFTFGNERYQYYETICGGSGAGPQFHGTSAVQTHMTNSRLTDPEVLELRFPVVLESFAIRRGSGGKGQYHGGDGVVRRLRFQAKMTASLLSGRRHTQPFGLSGGQQAWPGTTEIIRQNAPAERLEATASVEVQSGDVIVVSTPGGGGYGPLATSH